MTEYQKGFSVRNGQVRFRSKTNLPPYKPRSPKRHDLIERPRPDFFWTGLHSKEDYTVGQDTVLSRIDEIKLNLVLRTMVIAEEVLDDTEFLVFQLFLQGDHTQRDIGHKIGKSSVSVCRMLNADNPTSVICAVQKACASDNLIQELMSQLTHQRRILNEEE